ncbi:MAG: response regulator [bacterium]|nr:response regulator [bacterium]
MSDIDKLQKILIIDDEYNLCTLLRFHLQMEGFKVFTAHNAADGVEAAKTKLPDLILLDVKMPDTDGIQVCKILRRNRKTKHIPIFMITGLSQMGIMEDAFKAGANDYISKPFDVTTIVELVTEKFSKL